MKLGLQSDPSTIKLMLIQLIDIGLVLAVIYMVLIIIGERRTLWMVRGLIVLMLFSAFSQVAGLRLLSFVLHSLVIGSAVSMAVILQSEFRRFLEKLGQGDFRQMFGGDRRYEPEYNDTIEEIVEAVKQLSQNRTGALMIIETDSPIDERDFSVPGVKLNADLTKELLQTIFQPKTILHDGAVLIRDNRVISAAVILPLSEQKASRQLGTRHRAAMGITEHVEKCVVDGQGIKVRRHARELRLGRVLSPLGLDVSPVGRTRTARGDDTRVRVHVAGKARESARSAVGIETDGDGLVRTHGRRNTCHHLSIQTAREQGHEAGHDKNTDAEVHEGVDVHRVIGSRVNIKDER